jgi:hypothetical protein
MWLRFQRWMRWLGFEQFGCPLDEIVRHTYAGPVLSSQVLSIAPRKDDDERGT